MRYIECPEEYQKQTGERSLFLAGGITGTANWQEKLVDMLKNEDLVLLNPRRRNYDFTVPGIEDEQIRWEFKNLTKANAVSFWFPKETVCPITLYELGRAGINKEKLFVGVDPKYARKRDIQIQLKLARPEIEIVYSLERLAEQIKSWGR